MALIGRRKERDDFLEWISSRDAELICVYGRRRVGKTFFVTETVGDYFAFDASGLAEGNQTSQLRGFQEALLDYGCAQPKPPADWWEAFRWLKELLDAPECRRTPDGMRIVFLDEFPWFDTPRSDFMNAFSDFWNRWAQRQPDIKVIICGSATSWILGEVLKTEGSLNRRVTRTLFIAPFTLKEVEDFLRQEKEIDWARPEIIECYLVFGGMPYYLRKLQKRYSLAQNITALCLGPQAPLRDEGKILLDSTLSNKPMYYQVLSALGKKKNGLARKEIAEAVKAVDGKGFSVVLMGLEECGYIRTYENPRRKGRKTMYQLIDPFLLFSMKFVGPDAATTDWATYYDTPSYNAWRGNAFEIAVINHLAQLKHALSLSSMTTKDFPWSSATSTPGAQVDLVIERPDKITYLCEMKCTDAPLPIDASLRRELARKRNVFKVETGTGNSVQTVLVSAAGTRGDGDAGTVARIVAGDDLFVF